MRLIIVFCSFIILCNGFHIPQSNVFKNRNIQPRDLILDEYYTRVDHFRPQNGAKSPFFYAINTDYYQPGGPIFLYISDTQGYEFFILFNGLIRELAEELNGAIVTTDIRYFWDNEPTDTLSFEDLSYLTIEQILTDIAFLINTVKIELNTTDSRIILFGAGFGGTIATWCKQKYPQLIDGVWSSSGIFVSTEFTAEPYMRLSQVIEEYGSEECSTNVRNAFDIIEFLVLTNDGERLQESLNLCSPFNTTSDLNIALLFETYIEFIMEFMNDHQNIGMEVFCEFMSGSQVDALVLLGEWAQFFFGEMCFDISYENRIAKIADESLDPSFSVFLVRQWYYLKCTQLGLHKITAVGESMFGRRVTEAYHFYACQDIFGYSYDFGVLSNGIRRLFNIYGGPFLNVNNVLFTNGLLDPWFNYGITYYSNQSNVHVINIPDVFRAGDMFNVYQELHPTLHMYLDDIKEILRSFVDM